MVVVVEVPLAKVLHLYSILYYSDMMKQNHSAAPHGLRAELKLNTLTKFPDFLMTL